MVGSVGSRVARPDFSLRGAGWGESAGKFPLSTPAALGNFFTTALVYRRHYAQEAPVVVEEHLALERLLALEGSKVIVPGALDSLWADQIPAGRAGPIQEAIAPETLYVGRVTRSFDG
jgi:hypothetical protein